MARILLVDDYDDIRWLLRDLLVSEGHDVLTARDGVDGLEKFDPDLVDLVLTDMNMPNMNGPQLIEAIHARAPQTPIIGMTGGLIPDLLELERQRLNIQGFFSKPMDLRELRSTNQTLLDRQPLAPHAA
mgnify:FL=1